VEGETGRNVITRWRKAMTEKSHTIACLLAVFAALISLPARSLDLTELKTDPAECARLQALHIDKQANPRANPRAGRLTVACSDDPDRFSPAEAPTSESREAGPVYLLSGSDINLISDDESLLFPAVTQAGSMIWGNGDDVVAVYTDTRDAPASFSGMSVSTDGGITFDRLDPDPFGTLFTDDSGSPAVAYDDSAGVWLAVTLTSDCGTHLASRPESRSH
jgi:hypothetical protein